MRVFVSATSIVSGGALNILKQFIVNARPGIDFFIAINSKLELEPCYTNKENIFFIRVVENSRLDRVKWDYWKAKKEIKSQKKIDIVISLQNTTLNVGSIRQIIYIHQGIFLHDKSWSFIKSAERKYAFYKYIYPGFIFSFSKPNTQFIVQTEWMRTGLIKKYNIHETNVLNIKPDITPWAEEEDDLNPEFDNFNSPVLFYPATGELFKNHLLILKAIKILHGEHRVKNIKLDIKIIFTLDVNSNAHIDQYLNENPDIIQYCEFTGPITYEKVKRLYDKCNIVIFPSYIESFGLPLLEAAILGKQIIAFNSSFAREVLDGYRCVEFIGLQPYDWAQSIRRLLKKNNVHNLPFSPNYKTSWKDFFELMQNNNHV